MTTRKRVCIYPKDIQRITKNLFQNGKVVSAVCHGPAALVNVQLDNGEMLLADKQVSGFTNEEELFLIPDAKTLFPFLIDSVISFACVSCLVHIKTVSTFLSFIAFIFSFINPPMTKKLSESVKSIVFLTSSKMSLGIKFFIIKIISGKINWFMNMLASKH